MQAKRTNKLSAQKVEVGIVFGRMLGTLAGAQYLARQEIALDVALRVLLAPPLRRRSHQCDEPSNRHRISPAHTSVA